MWSLQSYERAYTASLRSISKLRKDNLSIRRLRRARRSRRRCCRFGKISRKSEKPPRETDSVYSSSLSRFIRISSCNCHSRRRRRRRHEIFACVCRLFSAISSRMRITASNSFACFSLMSCENEPILKESCVVFSRVSLSFSPSGD